jgi:hypothetical protein
MSVPGKRALRFERHVSVDCDKGVGELLPILNLHLTGNRDRKVFQTLSTHFLEQPPVMIRKKEY